MSWHAITIRNLPPPPPRPSPPEGKPYPPQVDASYTSEVSLLPGSGVLAVVSAAYGDVTVLVSFDHGASWRVVALPSAHYQIGDLAFVDNRHWWISRWNVLYKTSDAGMSWKSVDTFDPVNLDVWSIGPARVIDSRHAWAEMQSTTSRGAAWGLAMPSDGGVHWTPVNVPQPG